MNWKAAKVELMKLFRRLLLWSRKDDSGLEYGKVAEGEDKTDRLERYF